MAGRARHPSASVSICVELASRRQTHRTSGPPDDQTFGELRIDKDVAAVDAGDGRRAHRAEADRAQGPSGWRRSQEQIDANRFNPTVRVAVTRAPPRKRQMRTRQLPSAWGRRRARSRHPEIGPRWRYRAPTPHAPARRRCGPLACARPRDRATHVATRRTGVPPSRHIRVSARVVALGRPTVAMSHCCFGGGGRGVARGLPHVLDRPPREKRG